PAVSPPAFSAPFWTAPPSDLGLDDFDDPSSPPSPDSCCVDELCEPEPVLFCPASCSAFIRARCSAFFWAFSCAFFFAAFFSAATLSFWARSRSALLTDWSSELDVSVMASVWPLGVLVNLPSAYFSAMDNTSFTYSSEWL